MKNEGKVKKNIYALLNKHKDLIERACDEFCTESQKKELMDSLLDERIFLPNSLTLARIPGIGLIYSSVLTDNPYVIATTIGLVALTDLFDGYAARNITKNPNKGGALLDACTDKLFSLALIIPAIFDNPLLLTNGFLETIIGLVNRDATKKGAEQKSTMLGKIKMWPLSATISLSYINMAANSELLDRLITLGVVTTGILEIINIIQYKKQAEENLKKLEEKKKLVINVDEMDLEHLEKLRSELVLGEEDKSEPIEKKYV